MHATFRAKHVFLCLISYSLWTLLISSVTAYPKVHISIHRSSPSPCNERDTEYKAVCACRNFRATDYPKLMESSLAVPISDDVLVLEELRFVVKEGNMPANQTTSWTYIWHYNYMR
jgi:hypothetical protein